MVIVAIKKNRIEILTISAMILIKNKIEITNQEMISIN